MSNSMRALFQRQHFLASAGRDGDELISLRHALKHHHGGLGLGLRAALQHFQAPVNGDGLSRGCKLPTQIVAGDLAYVVPSWVAVDFAETRTLEGELTKSKITHTDFPLKPWHTYYDWNFFIRVDPQYRYLLSQGHGDTIECEWDTAFFTRWAWPQDGSRIWMRGRWIYDCGHPKNGTYQTEIHPPKAIVTFRREAAHFAGNAGPTQANNAVIYIGRRGGYWDHAINDEDYEFDLPLPPRPHPAAVPVWQVVSKTGALPVQPQVTPEPVPDPQLLRVRIPLQGVEPHPEQYGAILSAGWSDPAGTESRAIRRVRVRVTKIYMDGDYDISGDEWYVHVGVNGRWQVWESIGGDAKAVHFAVELDLHPSDEIHITTCGFEADEMHDYMGDDSGYSWDYISNPALTQAQREAVEDTLFGKLAGSLKDENARIGYLTRVHASDERGSFVTRSDVSDYRLAYVIESR